MAGSPSIHVELDPGPWSEPEYADCRVCGETVSGSVVVQAEEPVRCRAVVVSVGWHTEGRGDRDEETLWEQRVHEGELLPGEHRFPFSATLPAEPMSYAGHYININWQVKATIDVAWARDPHAERQFYAVLPEP